MLAQEITIPVYFSKFNSELDEIISDVSKIKLQDDVDDIIDIQEPGKRESALSELINTISANGYQVCRTQSIQWISLLLQNVHLRLFYISFKKALVSGAHHSPNKQSKIPIIQGELFPILQLKNPNSEAAIANSKLPMIVITAHIDTFGLITVTI